MARLVSILTALVLLSTPLTTGCAAALPAITQVASVVAEVVSWIDLVESQARTASDAGLISPELAAKITAAKAAANRLRDAAQAGPAVYAAAVAEFEKLYRELLVVVGPMGVRPMPAGGRLAAAPPGTVSVPGADELGAKLREAGR